MSTAGKTEIWGGPFDADRLATNGEPYLIATPTNLYTPIPPMLKADGTLLTATRGPEDHVRVMEVNPESGKPVGELIEDFAPGTRAKRWSPTEPVLSYWDASLRWQTFKEMLVFRGRDLETGHETIQQIRWPDLEYEWFVYNRSHSKGVIGARDPAGGWTIQLHDTAKDETTPLVRSDQPLRMGRLSNADDQLAFVELNAQGSPEIRIANVETGAVRTIFRGPVSSPLEWSWDDSEIAFASRHCLIAADVRTAKAEVVTCWPEQEPEAQSSVRPTVADSTRHPSWSPDGSKLVWPALNWLSRKFELWIVDRATGSHEVSWTGEADYATSPLDPDWSRDGRFVSFTLNSVPLVEIWSTRNATLQELIQSETPDSRSSANHEGRRAD